MDERSEGSLKLQLNSYTFNKPPKKARVYRTAIARAKGRMQRQLKADAK